jgi:hypothetical protein
MRTLNRWENGTRVPLRLMGVLIAIMFGSGLLLATVALATDDPLMLNYQMISAIESSTLSGTSVLTMQLTATNKDIQDYHDVTITAASLSDTTKNYGSIQMGEVASGASKTVVGDFEVPDDRIDDVVFTVSHS